MTLTPADELALWTAKHSALEPLLAAVEAIVAPYVEAHDELVRARNYAMRQRDEERAAKEGNIRALNAALVERDAAREALARVEALAAEHPTCWITHLEDGRCTDFIGAGFGGGVFVEQMCCLPCRLRAAAALDQP